MFSSDAGGNLDIYAGEMIVGDIKLLTKDPSADVGMRWSPNSEQILFASDRDGNPELYIMQSDGSGVTRLTNHPGVDSDADWSP